MSLLIIVVARRPLRYRFRRCSRRRPRFVAFVMMLVICVVAFISFVFVDVVVGGNVVGLDCFVRVFVVSVAVLDVLVVVDVVA